MRRNNKRKNMQKKAKIVIRCRALNKPVFEHEVCTNFSSKINTNSQNNCVNCIHAF